MVDIRSDSGRPCDESQINDRDRLVKYIWGKHASETPSVPLHYPLLAVLVIAASIAPTTWFLSRDLGYLIVAGVLCLIIAYGVLFTSVRLTIDPAFLVLLGGYWLGLVAHYYYFPHSELLQYILVTPIAVFGTVVILPQFVEGRRQTFTMGLTVLSVIVALIGVWILWQPGTIDSELPNSIGGEVMGLYAIRSTSVFHNPNTYGFFMMVGCLAALYTVVVRGGLVWIAALGICLLGLFMSEGDAALIGLGVGSIVVLAGRSQWLSFFGIGAGVVGLYGLIQVGHVPEVMETTLMSRVDRWVLSLERLALDPLWGIGFVDPGPEINGARGPHNSYIHVLLNTGVIAGSLYLGALAYAVGSGIRRRWTPWSGFILGTGAGTFAYMGFESLFLGGLTTSSIVLGLFIGLMLLTDPSSEERDSEPATAKYALVTSRAGRAFDSFRSSSDNRQAPPQPKTED
ncbi:O-antigen ligase family protein [Halalkalicoccus tibetensis]|uniref:O-antigen ligase family protein n=1 Tax=Halalkalicoccus tibetensis TaxID=175632 RepID=UPI0030F49900